MKSLKRILANRANARKSTGPKSQLGKESSSINALSHGLSQPVSDRHFARELAAIAHCIQDDCGSKERAMSLAAKILEYERNETFQRLCLLGKSHLEETKAQKIADVELGILSDFFFDHVNSIDAPRFTSEHRILNRKQWAFEYRWTCNYQKLMNRMHRIDIRKARGEDQGYDRYLRRASNQLAKELARQFR